VIRTDTPFPGCRSLIAIHLSPQPQGSKRSPLLIIFLTVFIDMVGFGIIIPILPLYAERFHASPVTIGWLMGIYSGMQIIFMPILGKLSDRYGRRPVLLASLLGSSLGFALMAVAGSLPLLFAARIIDGATGGNFSTAQAYIADVSTPAERSRSMGLLGAAFGLGFTFGPMIGGLMSRISYGAPFYFAAALAAVNAVLLYLILPESLSAAHRSTPHARARVAEVFRHGRSGIFAALVATFFFLIAGYAIMTTFLALFTEKRLAYDAHAIGFLFGFIGILTAVTQGCLIRPLVAVFGEAWLARLGLIITTVAMFGLPFSGSLSILLVVCAGLAVGGGLASPTISGLASQMIERSWQGRALSLLQSAGALGRLVGPLIGGWLLTADLRKPIEYYGRTPFWAGGGLCLIALLLAFAVRQTAAVSSPADPMVEADV
jgi:multidrug resistance protein